MKAVAVVLILIGVLNFGLLIAMVASTGGTADESASTDGRYFVSDHGRRTEVTESTYRFSRIQSRSVLVTHPLGMLGMILLLAGHMNRHPDHLPRRFRGRRP